MPRFIFWQTIPSIHQAPFLRSLSEAAGVQVVLVTETNVSKRHTSSGWNIPDFGKVFVLMAPSTREWPNLVSAFSSKDSVHIFSGFSADGLVRFVSRRLLLRDSDCGVYVEVPTFFGIDFLGQRRNILLWRDRVQALRIRRKLDFVLAIGDSGAEWYRKAWFPREKVFPFAYFLESLSSNGEKEILVQKHRRFRISFVGQLIPLKAVDVLLHGLARVKSNSWELDIVGDGPERESLNSLSKYLGIISRIRWYGIVSNQMARQVIGQSHVLVLPSHYDGWGAVVSEALLAGVPAIVTDVCGSACAVKASGFGELVPPGDVAALASALDRAIDKGPISREERRALQNWARRSLNGESGAAYFLSIMEHVYRGGPRPDSPWRSRAVTLAS